MVEQLLLNLLKNAKEACEGMDAPKIELWAERIGCSASQGKNICTVRQPRHSLPDWISWITDDCGEMLQAWKLRSYLIFKILSSAFADSVYIVCVSTKKTVPRNILKPFVKLCGRWRIRTADILLVRQALWTSWANRPNFFNSFSVLFSAPGGCSLKKWCKDRLFFFYCKIFCK